MQNTLKTCLSARAFYIVKIFLFFFFFLRDKVQLYTLLEMHCIQALINIKEMRLQAYTCSDSITIDAC